MPLTLLKMIIGKQHPETLFLSVRSHFFKMNDKAPCRPSDVINYMKINHGVNLSYDKA